MIVIVVMVLEIGMPEFNCLGWNIISMEVDLPAMGSCPLLHNHAPPTDLQTYLDSIDKRGWVYIDNAYMSLLHEYAVGSPMIDRKWFHDMTVYCALLKIFCSSV